ncbi:cytochrome c maturation protein CcmE [Oceanomicrobium pacificus]|uniref:Cytochrome c-type biogenesis protein CcmE n=1 Tax=Oceanomicrobium pacificus TaxID=2692916 RepID=A0A6B0U5W6_9RHOB|nr:cytochrome c maturation protein CcmE [Oceanomicrobium pacificus]MXU66291.1 cytochrome c maturation protein CcmE [Oceanomicrobium pacificus]
MAGLKKKRRIQLIVIGAVLLAAATALVGYGFRDGIELFKSPTQIAEAMPEEGDRFRLGGLVKEGSWERGDVHRFTITDMNEDFPVQFAGIVPDLFREGQGTIVTGSIEGGIFVATEVLAKHDEAYMPKEVADALKEQGVFQPADG